MLYIDQPAQVGLSYDSLTNVTYDFLTGTPLSGTDPSENITSVRGTFGSFDTDATANTTQIAAHAVWHFLQGFLAAFPQYNPGTRPNSTATEPTGINLFAESYGGIYGPTFADFFEQQNADRLSGALPRNGTLEIQLTSLGIVNGFVDALVQGPSFPQFAYNNTYGIQAISQTQQINALNELSAPSGCIELTTACRRQFDLLDPDGEGDVASVNGLCANASYACDRVTFSPEYYMGSNRNVYDIRQMNPTPFPPGAYLEYLNNATVQQAIGARVNRWQVRPVGTEGYRTAEVTLGGIDTRDLDARTMQARKVPGLFFIGECVDVTGWLGGYNFQWAWASADAAGRAD